MGTSTINEIISKKIKKLRLDRNLTQKEVYEKLGIQQSQYSSMENGNRYFSVENLVKLANFFNISVDELIADNEFDDDFDESITMFKVLPMLGVYPIDYDSNKGEFTILFKNLDNTKEFKIKKSFLNKLKDNLRASIYYDLKREDNMITVQNLLLLTHQLKDENLTQEEIDRINKLYNEYFEHDLQYTNYDEDLKYIDKRYSANPKRHNNADD